MAREATKVELYGANNDGDPRSFTIASSATVAKGTFLKFADPRTASASTGTNDMFAGFANHQKEADYSTTISAWTNGIFEVTASGAITAGQHLCTAAPGNYVQASMAALASGAQVVGIALEDATADTNVTIRINI